MESKILHGDPASKIVKYADEIDADLIVMGSKGQGKLASVFLGSVSKHVVNNSKHSVLVVKRKNKEVEKGNVAQNVGSHDTNKKK